MTCQVERLFYGGRSRRRGQAHDPCARTATRRVFRGHDQGLELCVPHAVGYVRFYAERSDSTPMRMEPLP